MKLSKATLTAFNSFIHYLSPSAFEAFASFDLEDEVAHEDSICRSAGNSRGIQRCGPSYMGFPRKYNTYRGSV